MKALLCLLGLVVAAPALRDTAPSKKVPQDPAAAQMATALPGAAVAPVKQQAAAPERVESRRRAPAAPAARANDDRALRRSRSLRNAIPE